MSDQLKLLQTSSVMSSICYSSSFVAHHLASPDHILLRTLHLIVICYIHILPMEAEERQKKFSSQEYLPSESIQIIRRNTKEVTDECGKPWESGRLEFRGPAVNWAGGVLHFP